MIALLPIASRFASVVTEITPLGNGLINDTYLVATPSSPFVLQRINRTIFPAPEQIMANLTTLNRHMAQKTAASVMLQIPEILKTADNNSLYQDQNGDCWRALSFIANTEGIETIGTISDAEQAGFALGHFHRLISDLNPALLHDTLPGFHITPGYLQHYHQVRQQAVNSEDRYCAEFIGRFQSIADDLEAPKQQGLLALRVIHGDPKLNNFLFDKHSKLIVSIIDLDTVKPGLVHYDVGDCLRSCCYSADPVEFNPDICAALLKSYLAEAGAFFTEHDYHYLYPAIRLIPFELGIRFYTDYLEGNRYFKVAEPEQNLQRAAGQFRLCESIMAQETAIKSLISQLHNS
ncbi:MAG: aminoglycoside phosphotransferase family protein [Methylobacter sp.]|uniref:phosphotransferase enzyme family protein n=1 Tax=Methylobacter sp. TaxID=2051955 RepID=UPI0027309C87|nr:aminoglycoside phosphotransferase family protein [Methylobacter sp.]MDP1664153.1 aminoglycoside phosphotransferase family protein [Methylobacter sp.]